MYVWYVHLWAVYGGTIESAICKTKDVAKECGEEMWNGDDDDVEWRKISRMDHIWTYHGDHGKGMTVQRRPVCESSNEWEDNDE